MRWGNAQHMAKQVTHTVMHTCASFVYFCRWCFKGHAVCSRCTWKWLYQCLIYWCTYKFSNIPVSGVESTRVWHIKMSLNSYIVFFTHTALIKLFARHKLFSRTGALICLFLLLICRATVRDLPTLLHKVNMSNVMFHKRPIYIQCHLLLWLMYSVAMV